MPHKFVEIPLYRLIKKPCQIQLCDKLSGRKERKVGHIQRAINYQVLKYVRGKPGAMGKLSHYSQPTGAAASLCARHLSAPAKRARPESFNDSSSPWGGKRSARRIWKCSPAPLIRFIFASSAHGGGLCLRRHPRPIKLARLQELMAAF